MLEKKGSTVRNPGFSPHCIPWARAGRGWDTQRVLWHWIHTHHSIHLLWSSEFPSALSKLSAALWLMTASNSITNSLFYHHRRLHSSARAIFLWKYPFFWDAGRVQGYRSTFGVELRPLHQANSLQLRGCVHPPHYKYIFAPTLCALHILRPRGRIICVQYYN